MAAAADHALSGQCLCGQVTVHATPRSRNISVCHCSKCRTWTGGPFIALDCGDAVAMSGPISVFKSSAWAERVFCSNCGSAITWRLQEGGEYHLSSQLFTESDGFPMKSQVFIDEKPDNYNFAETTETMTGAQVFAMFAPDESNPNG
ncbi:MAG: GFA family protein [Pseudomonadota bacterium]